MKYIVGDCRTVLATLPAASVQCCVTSPPYYGLRDYGVAGQIGLEPTPDEYVAEMVAVFREVRRVLRDDGTLWLNVGDSYAAPSKGTGGATEKQATNAGAFFSPRKFNMGDAKQKDLMGIPWLLAFALRQPYYAGRIKREMDRVWLAAMVDGEGCFYIHRRPAGQHAGDGYHRTQDNYSAAFEVANTSEAIVARCMAIAGCGSITRQDKERRQPLYRWTVRSNEARSIAREIYPYLVAKQQQARLVCGVPSTGKAGEAAWEALKALHSGSTSDVDFAVPEPMLEPGWFLRSDVIWAKPNPMPESVRDRPTSAHEHVFLLSKSDRYYYDADAIREPLAASSVSRLAQDVAAQSGSERAHAGGKTNGPMKAVGGGRASDKRRGHGRRHAGFNDRWDAMPRDEQMQNGANARNVWTIATQPFSGAHFATMPPDLAERCIKAGTKPGDTVLDPFGGAGTTGLVADRLGRRSVMIDLSQDYADLAEKRLLDDRMKRVPAAFRGML